jgi:S1-C subfamily serine protease
MKKLFISFFLFCSLVGCISNPVTPPQSSTPRPITVFVDGTKLYEKYSKFVLVVEFLNPNTFEWDTLGSAFVVMYKGKQVIVTAKHVAEFDMPMRLRTMKGDYISIDNNKLADNDDIAVFVSGKALPFKGGIELAKSNPKIGSDAFHIGNPLGVNWSFTTGVISQYEEGNIIASTPIAPGSSGGLLLDKEGKMIGIAVAVIPSWTQFNYFEPVESLKALLDTK